MAIIITITLNIITQKPSFYLCDKDVTKSKLHTKAFYEDNISTIS